MDEIAELDAIMVSLLDNDETDPVGNMLSRIKNHQDPQENVRNFIVNVDEHSIEI